MSPVYHAPLFTYSVSVFAPQVNLESWPAIWNTTACRDSISAPAQCAELNPGFELAGEIDNQNNVDNRFLRQIS